MDTSHNPYTSYSASPPHVETTGSQLPLTILGLSFGTASVLGTLTRMGLLFLHQDPWRTWQHRISDTAPLVGLGIFAITACALLILLASHGIVRRTEIRFCQAFITLATLAMLMRIISEPNSVWVPHWPSYLLTACSGIAMGMVFLRFRKDTANNRI